MTHRLISRLCLAGALSLAVACASKDTEDPSEDGDITDIGDFDDGGGSGEGGGSSDDAGGDGVGDDAGGDEGSGDSAGDGGDIDGMDEGGSSDDGGGGDGSGGSPPLPAFELPEQPCEDDLVWQVFMVDTVSGICTLCSYGDSMWVVAAIQNPCAEDMEIDLNDGYVIGGMSLVNTSTGDGEGVAVGGTGRVDTVTVPAEDYIYEALYTPRLTRGDYELDLSFNDTEAHRASYEFTVE